MAEWFRSKHGAPFDPKWTLIAHRARVSRAVVIALAWCLMDMASRAEDRGDVSGADPEELAVALDIPEEQVVAVLSAMSDKARFLEDGRIRSWERHQPKWEGESSTERVRKHREAKKSAETKQDETVKRVSCNDETGNTAEQRREDNNPPKPPLGGDGPDDRIDQIRKAIWRQHGLTEDQIATKLASANAEGLRQVRSWLQAGLSLQDILDAVSRGYDEAKEPIRRPWVYLDAVMNSEIERKAKPEPAAVRAGSSPAEQWRERAKGFIGSRKIWLPSWGPKPGEPRCEVPPEILREFGLGQQ